MNDLFTRNSQTIDNEDIFLDSLREQALSLNINLTEEEGIRRYPSSKDLDKRWSKNILSKKGGDEE